MSRKNTEPAVSVVAQVQQQTAQAAALASIVGQDRLADPRLNPAVRTHADELRDVQQRKVLEAEHSRVLRRHRVADRRADEAERTLEAIALARRASSPARSVLALHTGKRLYLRLSLAASVTLSIGSALGVEAAANALHAPTGSGYIAEVGLTGLATAAITYRAHLAEHRGVLAKGSWQARVLWALMTVPLLVSVACNLGTLNAVGAFCAIGAVAFSLLSCVIADRSSAAMQDRAEEVSEQDEREIGQVAMGDDLFTATPDVAPVGEPPAPAVALAIEVPAVDPVADEASAGVGELEAFLASQEPPQGSGPRAIAAPPAGDGPNGAAKTPEHAGGHIVGQVAHIGAHIDPDQEQGNAGQPGSDRGSERVSAAAAARREAGVLTRYALAVLLDRRPRTVAEAAEALGVSVSTVKRHRAALRDDGFDQMSPDQRRAYTDALLKQVAETEAS